MKLISMLVDQSIESFELPKIGSDLSPDAATALAIQIGYQGISKVSPNPLVGCVIVDKNHRFLSAGYHANFGDLHAEANALKNLTLRELLKDATVYVSLEPCAHEGKQPSCARMLSQLPIKKVVMAMVDPNPLVAGKGQNILEAAGISCDLAKTRQKEARELMHAYLHATNTQKPFVALKASTDMEGNFALQDSQKLWITNQRTRRFSHFLRAYYDAILIGKNTVINDNPYLDIRYFKTDAKNPKVIVLDANAEVLQRISPRDLNILTRKKSQEIIWVVKTQTHKIPAIKEVFDDYGVKAIEINYSEKSGFDLQDLLAKLFLRNIHSLLIEGGAMVYSSFLDANLVDRIYHFKAPYFLSGENKRHWLEHCNSRPKLGEPNQEINLEGDLLKIYDLIQN